eukprot:scaffold651_cov174-Ochromonas_danica.AAC.3
MKTESKKDTIHETERSSSSSTVSPSVSVSVSVSADLLSVLYIYADLLEDNEERRKEALVIYEKILVLQQANSSSSSSSNNNNKELNEETLQTVLRLAHLSDSLEDMTRAVQYYHLAYQYYRPLLIPKEGDLPVKSIGDGKEGVEGVVAVVEEEVQKAIFLANLYANLLFNAQAYDKAEEVYTTLLDYYEQQQQEQQQQVEQDQLQGQQQQQQQSIQEETAARSFRSQSSSTFSSLEDARLDGLVPPPPPPPPPSSSIKPKKTNSSSVANDVEYKLGLCLEKQGKLEAAGERYASYLSLDMLDEVNVEELPILLLPLPPHHTFSHTNDTSLKSEEEYDETGDGLRSPQSPPKLSSNSQECEGVLVGFQPFAYSHLISVLEKQKRYGAAAFVQYNLCRLRRDSLQTALRDDYFKYSITQEESGSEDSDKAVLNSERKERMKSQKKEKTQLASAYYALSILYIKTAGRSIAKVTKDVPAIGGSKEGGFHHPPPPLEGIPQTLHHDLSSASIFSTDSPLPKRPSEASLPETIIAADESSGQQRQERLVTMAERYAQLFLRLSPFSQVGPKGSLAQVDEIYIGDESNENEGLEKTEDVKKAIQNLAGTFLSFGYRTPAMPLLELVYTLLPPLVPTVTLLTSETPNEEEKAEEADRATLDLLHKMLGLYKAEHQSNQVEQTYRRLMTVTSHLIEMEIERKKKQDQRVKGISSLKNEHANSDNLAVSGDASPLGSNGTSTVGLALCCGRYEEVAQHRCEMLHLHLHLGHYFFNQNRMVQAEEEYRLARDNNLLYALTANRLLTLPPSPTVNIEEMIEVLKPILPLLLSSPTNQQQSQQKSQQPQSKDQPGIKEERLKTEQNLYFIKRYIYLLVESLFNLGRALHRLNSTQEAKECYLLSFRVIPCYKRAHAQLAEMVNHENKTSSVALPQEEESFFLLIEHHLATVYFKEGDYLSALPHYRAVYEAKLKHYGAQSPAICGAANEVASLYTVTHQFNEAWTLYQQTYNIRLAAYGPRHPDSLLSLLNRAYLNQKLHHWEEAKHDYQQCLTDSIQLFGADHAFVQKVKGKAGTLDFERQLVEEEEKKRKNEAESSSQAARKGSLKPSSTPTPSVSVDLSSPSTSTAETTHCCVIC